MNVNVTFLRRNLLTIKTTCLNGDGRGGTNFVKRTVVTLFGWLPVFTLLRMYKED